MALRKILIIRRDISASLSLYVFHLLYIIIALIVLKYSLSSLSILDQNLTVARIIMLAYILFGVLFIGTQVNEKELKIRNNLRVMGVKPLGYWLGTFVTDMLLYLFSVLILIIMIYITQLQPLILSVEKVFVLMLAYGFAFVSFAYLWTFVFRNFHSATHVFPMVLTVLSFGLPYILIYLFDNYIYENDSNSALQAQKVIEILTTIFCPVYQLQQGLTLIGGNLINSYLENSYFVALGLWCQSIVFTAIIVIIEINQSKLGKCKGQHTEDKVIQSELQGDQSIIDEAIRTKNPNSKDQIQLFDVTKHFGSFRAIKGVTYGVEPGQIFALLGPNGAGKSTSFNILTGTLAPSTGSVYINSQEIKNKNMKIYENVGICPQHDSLWDHLTVREHLLIYGIVKGLKNENLHAIVNYYLESMFLKDYTNVKALRLSGGNKRKLCATLAMLASPRIQFFDEPSTGIDPIAKRYLWNTMMNNMSIIKGSIIMTTHSMKEAESLGNKIGIMVNGKFACLNTLNQLRTKFGSGYNIIIKKFKGKLDINVLEEELKKIFPNAVRVVESEEGAIVEAPSYQISNGEFKFSKAFELLEKMKEEGKIDDFSILSSSLEQIFIQMAKLQVRTDYD